VFADFFSILHFRQRVETKWTPVPRQNISLTFFAASLPITDERLVINTVFSL